jgi:hypothetical protein
MATKYLIPDATYCGDGTTSAEAASAGAVGAWNNINVFEGTAPAYGALAAGDVVYIRSKTGAGADANKTVSVGAAKTLGAGAGVGTETAPVTWVLDSGNVWSGINGTLKYTMSTQYVITFRTANIFIAETPDALVIECTAASPNEYAAYVYAHVKNLLVDYNSKTNTAGGSCIALYSGAVLENLHYKIGRLSSNVYRPGITAAPYGTNHAVLINPDIEITNSGVGGFLFGAGESGIGTITVIGGQVRGAGALSGQYLWTKITDVNCALRTIGFQIPRVMSIVTAAYVGGVCEQVEITGCDGGLGGVILDKWGMATSRSDNYPPLLSAQFPDSVGSQWSWRVYPQNAAPSKPVRLPSAKVYTDSTATKTITLSFLVSNTFTLSKFDTWALVLYTDDATGLVKTASSRVHAGGALDSSSASWSATTWGSINLTKKQISIGTPTSIRQNTLVTVIFYSIKPSVTTDDILFLDPDFGIA